MASSTHPSGDSTLSQLSKALREVEKQREKSTADLSTLGDDFRCWRKQTIADLIGLPRICPRRRCHRKRRCAIDDVPCIDVHRDLVAERLAVLLGYSEGELFADVDDDLRW